MVGDSTSCTLLPGLQAVGPSYGMQIENGAVIGCGVVSGEIAPFHRSRRQLHRGHDQVSGGSQHAETHAIERYRPSLIVWGSTDEHNSIVVDTPAGSKILDSGSPAWKSIMSERIDTRVEKFLATGARVILLLEPPIVHGGQPQRR